MSVVGVDFEGITGENHCSWTAWDKKSQPVYKAMILPLSEQYSPRLKESLIPNQTKMCVAGDVGQFLIFPYMAG